MASRIVFVGVVSLLFFGFEAWAETRGIIVTGEGIITGQVIDSITRESIFGARITDVTDEANEIPGSFAGNGTYFIRNVPEGTRNVKVTAPGYDAAEVTVDVESFVEPPPPGDGRRAPTRRAQFRVGVRHEPEYR